MKRRAFSQNRVCLIHDECVHERCVSDTRRVLMSVSWPRNGSCSQAAVSSLLSLLLSSLEWSDTQVYELYTLWWCFVSNPHQPHGHLTSSKRWKRSTHELSSQTHEGPTHPPFFLLHGRVFAEGRDVRDPRLQVEERHHHHHGTTPDCP